MKIWVLVITHKHGEDVTAYRSEVLMKHGLAEFCRQWWSKEFGIEKPMPKDDDALVNQYFFQVSETEQYDFHECDLI